MKRALSTAGQLLLFLLTAFAGMLLRLFHTTRVLSQTVTTRRVYEFDWLITVVIVYLVCLLIGTVLGRIRTSWIASTTALVLALLIVVLFTHIGYKDISLVGY